MGGDIVFLIPITAIVLGIGSGIIRSILSSQERRLEIRLKGQQGQNENVIQQLQALRAELAELRDTSTQYDLSLDGTMRHLAERVDHLETKARGSSVSPVSQESVQSVGRQ